MHMHKATYITLLVGGVTLAVLGIRELNIFASNVPMVVTFSPRGTATWMLALGVAMSVIGVVGLVSELGGFKTSASQEIPLQREVKGATIHFVPRHARDKKVA